jgi:O-antigen/teichoic acid export membrane protein
MEPIDSNQNKRSLEIGKFTAEGATSLFLSKVAQQAVSIIGSILLIRLLVSPAVYAFIGIATTVPGLVMLGNFSGVNAGLTRYLSLHKVEKDSDGIWSSFWSAVIVAIVTGSLLSILAYFLASPIGALIGKNSVVPFLQIASPLPIVWVLEINMKSTLLSLGRAKIFSSYQILDEVLLSSFPVTALLLGYGVVGALIAMVLANFVSGSIVFGIAVSTVFRQTQKGKRRITFRPTVRKLVTFGFLLGISNSYGTFAGQVVNLTIAKYVSLGIYGLYTVAQSASVFASYITDPINSMIFPAFSQVKGSENRELLGTIYRQAIRYSSIIYFPVGLFFTIFAKPFLVLFFGQAYSGAGIFLTVLSAGGLSYGLGAATVSSLLGSQGFSKYSGVQGILTTTLGITAALTLMPSLGLLPYLIVSSIIFLPSYFMNIRKVKNIFDLWPPLSSMKTPYLSLFLSASVSVPILFISIPAIFQLIVGFLAIFGSYVLFVTALKAVNLSDTLYLRTMLSNQHAVSRLVSPFLKLIDCLITIVGAKN